MISRFSQRTFLTYRYLECDFLALKHFCLIPVSKRTFEGSSVFSVVTHSHHSNFIASLPITTRPPLGRISSTLRQGSSQLTSPDFIPCYFVEQQRMQEPQREYFRDFWLSSFYSSDIQLSSDFIFSDAHISLRNLYLPYNPVSLLCTYSETCRTSTRMLPCSFLCSFTFFSKSYYLCLSYF